VTTLDYDNDDDLAPARTPRQQIKLPARRRRGWRWRLAVWLLALAGTALLALAAYALYLNQQLNQSFAALLWQEPTRVYARPLRLSPGLAMDAQTLRIELDAAAYREGDGVRPGTWQRAGSRWLIASRGFADVDGAVPPGRVEVILAANGQIAQLRSATTGEALDAVRLDPARIATLYGQRQEERRLVRLTDVPLLLTDTLQAVEDRNFAHHLGIDVAGIARALLVNLRSGQARQGASTLTQQLARSGLTGIGAEQTLWRKFNEMLYALLIEARHDKASILEAYLNQVYLGQRGAQAIHGVAAGAEFWFSRALEELDTEHVALLVGMIRGPSYYDPRRHPERARERRDAVLLIMRHSRVIDEAEYARALAAPLNVSTAPGHLAANRFPAYVDLVRQQLASDESADALHGGGLRVMSALVPSAQEYAEAAVAQTLNALQASGQVPLQAGLVLTDVHAGEIIAALGNRHRLEHGFNRARDARRPVGSLLKPFVYVLALAQPQRWSLATTLEDAPISITLNNGQRWMPDNFDGNSHGSVALIDALAHSYNQATVRLGLDLGPERLSGLIHSLTGIHVEAHPALILGAMDESPQTLAQLYQFFATGGTVRPLGVLRGVLAADGTVLVRSNNAPISAQPGDASAAALTTIALQHALRSGTGRQLMRDGLARLQPAGKTGTSNDGRDSWFAGWSGDHLAVIWVGNDDNQPTGLSGASGALKVWSWLFLRLPSTRLEVNDRMLEWRWVLGENSTDADCRDARRLAFARGFAPPYRPCAELTGGAVRADGE